MSSSTFLKGFLDLRTFLQRKTCKKNVIVNVNCTVVLLDLFYPKLILKNRIVGRKNHGLLSMFVGFHHISLRL